MRRGLIVKSDMTVSEAYVPLQDPSDSLQVQGHL
jgi:hypothetical protein